MSAPTLRTMRGLWATLALVSSLMASGQSEADFIYHITTGPFSDHAEKLFYEAFAHHEGLVRLEAYGPARTAKVLSNSSIALPELLAGCSQSAIMVHRIVEMNSGVVLYSHDPDIPPARPLFTTMDLPPYDFSEAKRQFLEAHPDWRRLHPTTDQDSSPEQ